ncbi:MAG: hypothetical protein MJ213_03995 [Bacilli bacterium]|nr:hypothetical protein [Bacilli bacterium]
MSKANKVIKIISPLLVSIASLVMVILAIVNLANGGKSEEDITIAFRIIISAMLILGALASTYIVVSKDPRHFDVGLVVYNGLLLGFGIFIVLKEAGAIADLIIGKLIPCILIGLGAFFIIATIISLANKINKRGTDIFAMIAGSLMLVAGILILCLATNETINVLWLIIGILLLVYSIFALVAALKKDKNVIDENPKEIK